MKCPRDGKDLHSEIFCGIEIDSCAACDGTWMDKGEIAKVVGMEKDMADGRPVGLALLRDRAPGQNFTCPKCDAIELDAYYFSGDSKLIVDLCPRCHGIWLDTNEMKKIVEKAFEQSGV